MTPCNETTTDKKHNNQNEPSKESSILMNPIVLETKLSTIPETCSTTDAATAMETEPAETTAAKDNTNYTANNGMDASLVTSTTTTTTTITSLPEEEDKDHHRPLAAEEDTTLATTSTTTDNDNDDKTTSNATSISTATTTTAAAMDDDEEGPTDDSLNEDQGSISMTEIINPHEKTDLAMQNSTQVLKDLAKILEGHPHFCSQTRKTEWLDEINELQQKDTPQTIFGERRRRRFFKFAQIQSRPWLAV